MKEGEVQRNGGMRHGHASEGCADGSDPQISVHVPRSCEARLSVKLCGKAEEPK